MARKELQIVSEGASKRVKFVGGGELPEMLQGLFTSDKEASRAIAAYRLKQGEDKLEEGQEVEVYVPNKTKRSNKQI